MTGPVEAAIRARVRTGEPLATCSGRAMFVVDALPPQWLVLSVGAGGKWTIRLPWAALEGIPELLKGHGWVRIGSSHSADADPESLDGYLKGFSARSAGSYIPVVLERAGVIEVNCVRPATVRLRQEWRPL